MSDLDALVINTPEVGAVGPDDPYVLMRSNFGAEQEQMMIDADVEWVGDGPDRSPGEVRIAVTERTPEGPRAVVAAVFDCGSGALLRAGETVSTSRPVEDPLERGGYIADLAVSLTGAVRVNGSDERKAA